MQRVIMFYKTINLWIVSAFLLLLVTRAPAAVLYVETFASDDAGWTGPNFDTFGHDPAVGLPPGSIYGTLDAPSEFFPTIASFRADSLSSIVGGGAAFTGNYYAAGATGIKFDFLAVDVIPSTLALVIHGAGYTFTYGLAVPGSIGSWVNYGIPITFVGWVGGTASEFSSAIQNVQYVEVRMASSGSSMQTYHLDNFELSGELDLLPSIPEPATGLLYLGVILLAALGRRRLLKRLA